MPKKLTSVEVFLPYFKQGDDFAHCLEQCDGRITEALEMDAECLRSAADILLSIRAEIQEKGVEKEIEVNADTHCIWIYGPEEFLQSLIDKELASRDPFEDEDLDDEEEEDEGEDEILYSHDDDEDSDEDDNEEDF